MSTLRYHGKMLLSVLLTCSGLLPTAGCGSQQIVHAAASSASVVQAGVLTMAPGTATVPIGTATQFSLSSGDAGTAPAGCAWTSSNPAILTSQGGGKFLSVAIGTASISVTCGDDTVTATAAVTSAAQPNAIVITAGGTYSGDWSSNDISTPAVLIHTDEPVVVVNSTVTGPGILILVYGYGAGADITLRNITGNGLNPNVRGLARGLFLGAEAVSKLSVTHCTMIGNAFGVGVSASVLTSLDISNNVGIDQDDRISDGNGGYLLNQRVGGHFIEFNGDTLNGGEIAWNQLVNSPLKSSIEDIITFIGSPGNSAHPVLLHDNYLQGAFAYGSTEHYNGGGIQFDGGSSDPAHANGFVNVYNNVVVHTEGYGISIGAGHDITVSANRVVSCGQDGLGHWWNSLGNNGPNAYGMWNYYQTNQYYNNHITGNTGGVIGFSGAPEIVDFNIPSTSANIGDTLNNTVENNAMDDPCWVNGQISQAAEAAEWKSWQARLSAASLEPGDLH